MALLSAIAFLASPAMAEWKPSKPITIIVPWAAGGSTDQVTRVVAGEIEDAIGAKVVIVNQPGASGSIGTKSALDAPKDGYTWAAGAAGDVGTYRVLGLLETDIQDWNLYFDVANVAVVGVNASAPYKTMDDLLNAFKAKPGQIKVATAGQSSAGHLAIEIIRKHSPFEYKHVTYDGGNPAVIATVAGETEVVTQLAVEQADMLRAGKLRALAVLSDQPLKIEGYGEVPPLTKWITNFDYPPNYFGIWVPRGAPHEVVETMNKVWREKISKASKLQKYAESRGAVFAPYYGMDALRRVIPYIQNTAYVYADA
ncbi:MAG: tripartite tricarboxylate transporter substrate binding protein, partial [Deltaproteobacteria bacterium]|nr:tripartite tricarboxylate transporter substrate binding protein [Deltaproteobacteria bacterium]